MKPLLLSTLCLLFILGGAVSPAWATVNGSVEWNYVDYERENEDSKDFKASSFKQRYSILYGQSGLLGAGRLGSWDLSLGAEWAAYDTKIDGSKIDDDSFKILYSGELLVAPGALPFRLHAYSYDLAEIRTREDGSPDIQRMMFFRPGVATDLYNGQTIVTGVQLLAGIRNGSYLGQYRDVLSKFPRLLLDYRDVYHRDLNAINKTKYRQRDLAFVSLNKKDNWFHYRIYDYNDYIEDRHDKREEVYLLGTIDHTLKRQWINLTNWIKLSVDGSYSTIDNQQIYGKEERYDVNLYSVMERRGFELANFTHFSRERIGSTLTQYLDVPTYLNNRISPDTNLRGQVVLNRWEQNLAGGVRDKEDIYYSSAKYETNITRRVKYDYGIEAEYNTRERSDGQGLRAQVEAYSNLGARGRLDWYANLGMALYYGDVSRNGFGYALDDDDTDYWENFGSARATYSLTRSTTLEASQELVFGFGSLGAYNTSYLAPMSTRGFNYTDGEVARDDDYFRSQTGLALEHRWRRLSNRVAGLYKHEEDSVTTNWSFELQHRLDYKERSYSLRMTNFFSNGDAFNKRNSGVPTGVNPDVFSADKIFRHDSHLNYLPNKYWVAGIDIDAEWRRGADIREGGKRDNTLIMLTQRLQRNFYAVNGVIRRLADIEQRIEYEKFIGDSDREFMRFAVAGHYYPTYMLSFGSRLEYTYYHPGYDTVTFSLTSGLHFPKFQVDFEYDYGTDEDRKVVVQRYEVNVRKTF